MKRKYDILYCEGAGNLIGAFESWKSRTEFLGETSVTFSGQLFEYCKVKQLSLCAVSHHTEAKTLVDGAFTIVHMPRWNFRMRKIGHDLTMLVHAIRLSLLALRIRPKVIFFWAGVSEPPYIVLLKLSGAKIVPILHNTLWPEGFPPHGLKARFSRRSESFFWRRCVAATLAVSPAAARQVQSIAPGALVTVFRPSFPVTAFANSPEPKDFAQRPFRITYAGRMEENKGVFDILEIAARLRDTMPLEIALCGEGSALEAVRQRVAERGLEDTVKIYGKLSRPELLRRYLDAHAVIVPTRSTFTEGFAMVVAEAILLLRPVITSPVVPAAELLSGGIVLAKTDDVDSYVSAINALAHDRAFYLDRIAAARKLKEFILDDSESFFAGVKTTMQLLTGS